MIWFEVPGIPAPQGSKRHVGGGRMVESSRSLPEWRASVAWLYSSDAADGSFRGEIGGCLNALQKITARTYTMTTALANPSSYPSTELTCA